MRRREFLVESRKAAVGCALLPFSGCVAWTPRARSAENTFFEALVPHLERQIPNWMREAAVPGVGISIINDAKVAWRRGFGVRDRASETSVDADTMFEAASMSKPVFAFVVMKLCETGLMNLDTPLTHYTSDRFLQGDARLELITARHVLSHTTGFQNWRSENEPLKIHFTPGERYLYSGEGYNYLQTVVTQLLGQEFEMYMNARLFVPLRMGSSGYIWDDAVAERMARPHDALGAPVDSKKSTPESVARYGAAGALLTTPMDYAQFMIAIIDPSRSDMFRLHPHSVAEMLRPHVKIEGGRYPASRDPRVANLPQQRP